MHYYHLKYVKVTLNIYFFKDIDVRMMYCVEIEVILFLFIFILLMYNMMILLYITKNLETLCQNDYLSFIIIWP